MQVISSLTKLFFFIIINIIITIFHVFVASYMIRSAAASGLAFRK